MRARRKAQQLFIPLIFLPVLMRVTHYYDSPTLRHPAADAVLSHKALTPSLLRSAAQTSLHPIARPGPVEA